MVGGPSHIDLFDPKPELIKHQGKPLPESFGKPVSQFTKGDTPLLASTRTFKKHGQSGLEVSDLMPNLAGCVDDIAFLRSCWCTSTVHAPAMYELHSGRTQMGCPSLGSWVTYGLGSVSDNLPAYCVMTAAGGDAGGRRTVLGRRLSARRLSGHAAAQGRQPHPQSQAAGGRQPRAAAAHPRSAAFHERNRPRPRRRANWRPASPATSWPSECRQHAPEAVDLSRETAATQTAYGLDDKRTADFGTRCLLARRLVERGVRFVQLYSGGGPLVTQWDAHDDINDNHEQMCGRVDRPIAALLNDLKQRGLLDTTLVVWASEFGRTPMSQGGKGRDHNPYGYTMWLAGGGVKGGQAIGATDEFGLNAVAASASASTISTPRSCTCSVWTTRS